MRVPQKAHEIKRWTYAGANFLNACVLVTVCIYMCFLKVPLTMVFNVFYTKKNRTLNSIFP